MPEAIKGEEEPRLKPPKRARKISAEGKTVQLDRFIEGRTELDFKIMLQ